MLEHYVVFKPLQGHEADLDAALAALEKDLTVGADGLLALTWGKNTNKSGLERGYTHGCLGRFADPDAFNVYWNHPAHVTFMGSLDVICAERFALDYTTSETA